MDEMRHQPAGAYPDVPVAWLVKALVVTLAGILVLIWLALCLLFWQGSWQLLYHPAAAVTRTPATAGLAYEPVRFAPDPAGAPQLTGWWVPADGARFTVLYLHGADGNLGETVDALAALHAAGLSIFAMDYRGYGQSLKARPSEAGWVEDGGAALDYLTGTRHLSPGEIVVYGQGLGANLAAELAEWHYAKIAAGLAGMVLDRPAADGASPIFADPRSRMVPARWLVKDRWDLMTTSMHLSTPSLWLLPQPTPGEEHPKDWVAAYGSVGAERPGWNTRATDAYSRAPQPKSAAWLRSPSFTDPHYGEQLGRWMDDLPDRR